MLFKTTHGHVIQKKSWACYLKQLMAMLFKKVMAMLFKTIYGHVI